MPKKDQMPVPYCCIHGLNIYQTSQVRLKMNFLIIIFSTNTIFVFVVHSSDNIEKPDPVSTDPLSASAPALINGHHATNNHHNHNHSNHHNNHNPQSSHPSYNSFNAGVGPTALPSDLL